MSKNRSTLSEVRESHGSPTKHSKKSDKLVGTVGKSLTLDVNTSSDEENPLPKSLRKKVEVVKKKRKIAKSSDEEDMFESVSQHRPEKRTEKIFDKINAKRQKKDDREKVSGDHAQPRKRPPKTLGTELSKEQDKGSVEDSDDEHSDFIPPKKNKCRESEQTSLQLRGIKSHEKKSRDFKGAKQEGSKKVEPEEFFKTFTDNETQLTDKKRTLNCTVKNDAGTESRAPNVQKSEGDAKKLSSDMVRSKGLPKDVRKQSSRAPAKPVELEKTRSATKLPEKVSGVKKKTHDGSSSILKLPEEPLSSTTKHVTSPKKTGPIVQKAAAKIQPRQRKQSPVDSKSSLPKYSETGGMSDDQKNAAPVKGLPWVDKYKPTSLKQVVGQNGEKSPLNKLLGWLRDWSKYHLGKGGKQKRPRPPPWMAQNDGTSFKAALLSGPPGVGKTTCAILACKEVGLQYVEMNASDARNKKLLDVRVAELLGSRQILQYFGKSANVEKANDFNRLTHVLIMDEVDGMSGNEDRAGLAELIQMIKDTKIPIICICNDRQSQKMRTLVNYCFDLRFSRPRVEQIRPRIQTIAFQEKLKLPKEKVDEIIEASNHDVRQTIYNLQLLSRGVGKDIQKKDVAMNLFEAARLLLNAGMGISEKQRMFFVDYSMMPLFVQENYPLVVSSKMNKKEKVNAIRRSADIISNGDLIDKVIRNGGSWSLLNEQALFSSVIPSMYMDGYLRSMINFPAWLGKNSSASKHQRLLQQLESHTFHRISADRHTLVTEYVPVMRDALALPLIHKENEGVQDVINVLDEYDLTRDDSDEIAELGTWSDLEDYRKKIQTKVKSALTRAYNKHSHLLPYVVEDVSKKRSRASVAVEYEVDEEGNLVEIDGEDRLNEDDKANSDSEITEPALKQKSSKTSGSRGGRSNKQPPRNVAAGRKESSRGRGRGR